MGTRFVPALFAVLLMNLMAPVHAADEHHPHHLAVGAGGARHNSKNSAFVGLDYAYRFENDYGVLVFAEQVRGDFDINAFGIGLVKFFPSGWKVAVGPGVETKLKNDKNLFLVHVSAGYDWHKGSWSFGPFASYDFIEDASNSVYLGFSVGYGF